MSSTPFPGCAAAIALICAPLTDAFAQGLPEQTPEEIAAIRRLNELQVQVSRADTERRAALQASALADRRLYEREAERHRQLVAEYERQMQEHARAEAAYRDALRAHEAARAACRRGDRPACDAAWAALGLAPPP